MDEFARRRLHLLRKMEEEKIDHFLISGAVNRYYLSGFELNDPQCNESSGFLLLSRDGEMRLFTDPRYELAAISAVGRENFTLYRQNKFEILSEYLKKKKIDNLFFEPVHLSFDSYSKLEKQGIELLPADRLFVEKQRMIKEDREIKALEESCALNHEVFSRIQEFLRPGISEKELAWEAEKLFRSLGAEDLSFSTIAAFGPNAAMAHAIPGERLLKDRDLVLVDMGGRLHDYCSDQTRSFWVGKESSRFLEVKEMVTEAQERAISEIRPGLEFKEAYYTARNYFQELGVDSYFTHALGHGIGLETHEPPSLAPTAEGCFRENMVVTVEPGLYYPKWGGVRWEYMIHVQKDGARVL
ncbi:MAG: M24 family metallopeptidase [Desulfonatronovibrionaceae bacterium]